MVEKSWGKLQAKLGFAGGAEVGGFTSDEEKNMGEELVEGGPCLTW